MLTGSRQEQARRGNMSRPRNKRAKHPRSSTGAEKPHNNGLSPESWEKIVRLLISSLEPIAKLIEVISRMR